MIGGPKSSKFTDTKGTSLLNDTTATRAPLTALSFARILSLGSLGVFVLDNLWRLDGHMDNIGSVVVELGI